LDRELKKQIKEDEIVSGFQKAAGWASQHAHEVKLVGGIVLVVAAAAAAFGFYAGKRRQDAAAAFAEAFAVWKAPVVAELPPGSEPPPGLTFASAQEKYKKAAADFEGIARRYPTLPAGRRARYLGAVARIELGEFAAAESVLQELVATGEARALEPALARLALADLHRRSGQLEKAIEAYRQYASDPNGAAPRDYALLSLGATQEEANKPADARASYQRLLEEFPASVYAPEARRRAEHLGMPAAS
jgi:tetratricopeptide (TPR) repeat protein